MERLSVDGLGLWGFRFLGLVFCRSQKYVSRIIVRLTVLGVLGHSFAYFVGLGSVHGFGLGVHDLPTA